MNGLDTGGLKRSFHFSHHTMYANTVTMGMFIFFVFFLNRNRDSVRVVRWFGFEAW